MFKNSSVLSHEHKSLSTAVVPKPNLKGIVMGLEFPTMGGPQGLDPPPFKMKSDSSFSDSFPSLQVSPENDYVEPSLDFYTINCSLFSCVPHT